ncbi:MAG: PadR family transcriptional regulator [Candidatus Hodarchaeota archaeon]
MKPPTEPTQAEIAILSLLSEGEQHGYALNETIEDRGFRNWTNIGFSSIYWILNRLEKTELISSRIDPSSKGPARKLYRLTKAGQTALLRSIKRSLSEPEPPRTRIDLGAAYIELLSPDESIQCLEQYRLLMRERINQILKIRQEQEPLPFGAEIIFDHGYIKGKAELEWVEDVLRRLKERQENTGQ